ncbi:hypothetical protein ACLX1H_008005 [Fusarium chlamydosporum]
MSFNSAHDRTGDPSTLGTLKHLSSTRLTPSLSTHIFSVQANRQFNQNFIPSQHLTLQFPPDLDPVSGPQNLSEEERCLSFTPFHVQYGDVGEVKTISLMARNGRVTGLLGLPRPSGPLIADIVQVAGGFPTAILETSSQLTYVCGGTGIAPFLAMAGAKRHHNKYETTEMKPNLLWSVRGNDFGVVEYLLNHQFLDLGDWKVVRIFVTSGEEGGEMVEGKPSQWWHTRFKNISQGYNHDSVFRLQRMEREDVDAVTENRDGPVLFCGSKQLEWQVKMWLLGKTSVYCTER